MHASNPPALRRRPAAITATLAMLMGLALGACGDSTGGGGADADVLDTSGAGGDTTAPEDTGSPLDTDAPTDGDADADADTQTPTDTQEPGDTTAPTDTDVLADTTAPTDTESGDTVSDDTTVTPTCTTLTLTGDLVHYEDLPVYELRGDFGLGDPEVDDYASIELYGSATGEELDLGSVDNRQYRDCSECLVVLADYTPGAPPPSATYFQTGGTLRIDPATPPGGRSITLTLTDVTLAETEIDSATSTSTPVADGACFALTSPTTLSTAAVTSCFDLDLSSAMLEYQGGSTYAALGDFGYGDPGVDDGLFVELFTSDTGPFDLGSADNSSYQTCAQCVSVLGDYTGGGGNADMFQTGGQLDIGAETPSGSEAILLTLTDLTVSEAFIDFDTGETTFTPGGVCGGFEGTVDVSSPVCEPSCGDRVCGSNGCGGTCGEGCATGTCGLLGVCEETPTCLQLTIGGDDLFYFVSHVYQVPITDVGAGAIALPDFLQLEFYSDATGNGIDLATGSNANYGTCAQCVTAVVDAGGGASTRFFFQSAGTMSIASGSNVGSGPITVGLTGLRLVEVTLDGGFTSTPVPGGACIDVTVTSPLTARQ
ncbi:MAG: hypothetical protein H6745_30725 [Deltaproteobacteria bacterium]|nr:hypothetical protein [Deltaproteobacteria bacterium]